MKWSFVFYVTSLIIWWGFLISGAIVRQEEMTFKSFIKEMHYNPLNYLICVVAPQIIVIVFVSIALLDYKSFKEIISNHYTK